MRFKGTYREEAWRRCQALAASDGIRFVPWSRDEYPNWSLPALEAAHCVALQGPEPFARLGLALYEAFFSRGVNIADRWEVLTVVEASGADMSRFRADLDAGTGRQAVLRDYEEAVSRDAVRAIPTVILEGGFRFTGLVPLADYRKAVQSALRTAT